ncbi:MAG: TonB-dependent receptor [Bacteroidales bacterium]|nr:TonB-dependent receptor [Bacteroidales bacterium]
MKKILLLSLLMVSTVAMAGKGEMLRDKLVRVHEIYEVNFIHDAALDLDIPTTMEIRKGMTLEEVLGALFKGTGIKWEINKKYVVLTRDGKKPKSYDVMFEDVWRDTLSTAQVTAQMEQKHKVTQTGLKRLNKEFINSGFAFFSTPDVIKSIQLLPGVATGTELLSGLYVHGGDGSDNLFLLDGVPIYQVSHLAGLFSSFNTDVIENIDFYKSGFPARFGSKMSSVVDVTTKDGDFYNYHGTFAIGLIDGHLQLEGPIWKGRTSFNIGLRRTWTETISIPALYFFNKANLPDKLDLRYAFSDFNAKITHKFSQRSILRGAFYMGRDVFNYKQYNFSEYYRVDESGTGVEINRQEESNVGLPMNWGNTLGSLNWRYNFSKDLSLSTTAYYTRAHSQLGFYFEDWTSLHPDVREKGGQYVNSLVHDFGLNADLFHRLGENHKLRYGATAQYHIYSPSAVMQQEYIYKDKKDINVEAGDSTTAHMQTAALYLEDEMSLGEHFTMNLGLRYSFVASQGKNWHSLEPRASLNWKINDYLSAKASYSEMSQPTHLVSTVYLDLPTNCWLPSTATIPPSRSREVAAGLYSNLPGHITLNVEGWFKKMDNLIEYFGVNAIFPPLTNWDESYILGQGRSWGMETELSWKGEKTEANAYYTLMWNQRKFDDFYTDWYRDRNDNRHKLTLMLKHKFTKRFEVYGAWNWRSGSRMTVESHYVYDPSVPNSGYPIYHSVYSEPNNMQLPDYHRLDLGFNFHKTTKRGNQSIWNLSIYNVYSRTNIVFAYVSGEYDDQGNLIKYVGEGLGLIPIIPTFSYTLKF